MSSFFKYSFALYIMLLSCAEEHDRSYMFEALAHEQSGIEFTNQLSYSEEVNPYTYKSFFNGGGVGVGDFNNDGLQDIFFAGNMESNRLYLNKGELRFEDITEKAGLETKNVWSTGVSVVDINGDSWLDIYVCKSGPPNGNERSNALYVNNGDLTFTERAREYNLDNRGLSVHAAFFDFDRDGDLDCYLLNNSIRSVGGFDLREGQREIPDSLGGNRMLRNASGVFEDITLESGIYSSEIGFGLGVTVSDINRDNWPDLYISNDFFERDYLYINNQDGTFSEELESSLSELSMGSMGADMADINNDGYTELFVTEMLPERHDRLMSKTVFESWDKYQVAVSKGYHHQFSRNVLQLNNQNGSYSEISRVAGVDATDWSWGALIFDMDNDGWKDIFVANGIYKDLLDQDYINFMADPASVREMITKGGDAIRNLVDLIPSEAVPNYYFSNNQNLTFDNQSTDWFKGTPTFSNGSAYADFDNDGDLDLVLNNLNQPAEVIKNNAIELNPNNGFLNVELIGEGQNSSAIGAKVILKHNGQRHYQELSPMRGFQSSVDYRLNFGLGDVEVIDTVDIIWPNAELSRLLDVSANQFLTVNQNDIDVVDSGLSPEVSQKPLFSKKEHMVDFRHEENEFVDFDRERLLFRMNSNEGPCACKEDVNGDGLEDLFFAGAKDQESELWIQSKEGGFMLKQRFADSKESETLACMFFDANGDGYPDLYMGNGGSELGSASIALADRLYLGDGRGSFEITDQFLPGSTFISTSTVQSLDFDKDGDLDLFVGGRLIPGKYGLPSTSYLLENDGTGQFEDITDEAAPFLTEIGLVTSSAKADMNGDGEDDIVVVGEWMPIKVLLSNGDGLVDATEDFGLSNTNGWYSTVTVSDYNGDGKPDVFAGNYGLNTRLKASVERPLTLFVNDFDRNGTLDQIMAMYFGDELYPLVQLKDLGMQIPSLKKEYLKFSVYRDIPMSELFDQSVLERSLKLEITNLETTLFLSEEAGRLIPVELPIQAQFSPVFAVESIDANRDGNLDLLLGGNMYKSKPELGINDASYGMLFIGNGKGDFEYMNYPESGIFCKGEVRDIVTIDGVQSPLTFFVRNDDRPYVVSITDQNQ